MQIDKTPIRVLVIENSADDTELIIDHLQQAGFDVLHERVETADEMTAALREKQWDIIISDFLMPGFTGLDALQIAESFDLEIPFIVVSGSIGEDLAVQAMRSGANDYLMKDRMARLGAAVERELRDTVIRRERKRMLEENRRQSEELKTKAEQLARSNAELERFAYLAAHDLQEPLRMVTAYAELLVKRYHQKLDSDVDAIVDFIRTGADRMMTLIQGLLSYSATLHDNQLALCPTEVNAVVERALANIQEKIESSHASVTHNLNVRVLADSRKLATVFEQLLLNAINFRKADTPPVIEITATDHDGEVIVAVSDQGIGVDPQYSEQIFGLFKRLHRDDAAGLGIGLALCRQIIQQHGGRIWVESSVGNGATFYFKLHSSSDMTKPVSESF